MIYLLLDVIREVIRDKIPGVTHEQIEAISIEIELRFCNAYRSRMNRLPRDEVATFVGERVSFD